MAPHGELRLFAALDPPAEVRAELASWARSAARAGAVRAGGGTLRVLHPDLLHLTICFLGERPAWEAEVLARLIESGGAPGGEALEPDAGELAVGAPVWLPPRHPRALAVELHEPTGALERLRDALLAAIAPEVPEAIPAEITARRFRPHLTVARMPSRAAPARRELPPTPSLRFRAEALVLYRSTLGREGASYDPLAVLPLARA